MDDSEYMTPEEFAALPSDAHHAVWKAAGEGRVDYTAANSGSSRRYHRAQVRELLDRAAMPGQGGG